VAAAAALVGALAAAACGGKADKPAPRPKSAIERRLRPAANLDIKQAAEKLARGIDELEHPYVLRWPLDDIDITSPYGVRMHPVVRRLLFHSGVDFNAPRGEPVLSAGPGHVIQAGWLPLTGNTVTLEHPGRLLTLYAHLDELLVFPGQQVDAGAPVGLIGSTGRSTGPHLHWSLYVKQGQGRHPVAPTDFIGRVIDPRHPPTIHLPAAPPPKPPKKPPKATPGH
jgi:murein DD-endopeptidase MepM/ murein hydrolase activator NlpD